MRLNGILMSKNRPIARIEDGIITERDPQRLPLYLLKTGDVTGWLESRAIDSHRTNSRLLKKALRLSASDDMEAVLRVHGATITDTYWLQAEGETLSYEQIRFTENLFDQLALRGDPDSFNLLSPDSRTPELTNTGSFEKCWRQQDGSWYMLKSGNELERFSELFICAFGKRLGLDMAEYEADGDYIRSKDFTQNASVNYEPASGIVLDNEEYAFNFRELGKFSERAAQQYVGMVYLDSLCFNMDRHTQNYGILRDVESGRVISLAPLFDHNIALIARGYPRLDRTHDRLIEWFVDFLKEEAEARRIFEGLAQLQIGEDLIMECIRQVPVQVDSRFVCQFIQNGEQQIRKQLEMGQMQSWEQTL